MADPEFTVSVADETPTAEELAAEAGALAGGAAAGLAVLSQGGGIIQAAQVMSQTLQMNQMINEMQSELHDMQMQVLDELSVEGELQVIEAAALPAGEPFASGDGGLAGLDGQDPYGPDGDITDA